MNRLENPDGLRELVDRLPYAVRLKCRELADSNQKEGRDASLKDITDFAETQAAQAQAVSDDHIVL